MEATSASTYMPMASTAIEIGDIRTFRSINRVNVASCLSGNVTTVLLSRLNSTDRTTRDIANVLMRSARWAWSPTLVRWVLEE